MNRKAFTLAELIGVITLLGIISVLIAPTIINQIKNSKNKIDEVTEKLIFSATDLYLDNKTNDYPKINNSVYCVTLQNLVDEKKLENPVIDSNGKEINLNKFVKVIVDNKQYKYELSDNCTAIKESILSSNNSCIKDKTVCPNETLVNVKVNESENYDFYVIKDTGSEVTLIMNKNLGSRLAWISQADYEAAGGTNWAANTDRNSKGPLTVLKALEQRTASWSNIEKYTYILTDDGGGNKYQPITRSNVRARMLTYTEIVSLGCTSTAYSCPSYLYENLSGSNTEDQPRGYWLSSSEVSSFVWSIHYAGYISDNLVADDIYTGVRPVIRVKK